MRGHYRVQMVDLMGEYMLEQHSEFRGHLGARSVIAAAADFG